LVQYSDARHKYVGGLDLLISLLGLLRRGFAAKYILVVVSCDSSPCLLEQNHLLFGVQVLF